MSKCQNAKMPKCQNSKMAKCQNAKIKCQNKIIKIVIIKMSSMESTLEIVNRKANDTKRKEYARVLYSDSKHAIKSILDKDGNIISKTITLTKLLIENIDKIHSLSGQDKKVLVIDVIFQIIDEDKGPLDRFDDIIKPLVSSAIDELIYVGKNGLKLSTLRNKESASCLCFLGYVKRIIFPSRTTR